MLSYYIMHDVVNSLEDKFKEQFSSFNRIFYCSNYIKILDFYNIFSLKDNPYNLKNKIENEKSKDVIKFFVNEIKENKFNQSIILLAYGYIINDSINHLCKPYFSSLCGISNTKQINKSKQKLQRIISYNLRDIFPEKNRDYIKTPSTYKSTEIEFNTITKLFTNVYNFSNISKILNICEENFYSYYNQNINFLYFKIKYYTFLDKHSNSTSAIRPCLKTKLYSKKIDYLNLEKRDWLNPYTNQLDNSSFLEIYQSILVDVNKKIEKLNNYIFYNEKTTIINNNNLVVENSKLLNPIFAKRTIFKKKK